MLFELNPIIRLLGNKESFENAILDLPTFGVSNDHQISQDSSLFLCIEESKHGLLYQIYDIDHNKTVTIRPDKTIWLSSYSGDDVMKHIYTSTQKTLPAAHIIRHFCQNKPLDSTQYKSNLQANFCNSLNTTDVEQKDFAVSKLMAAKLSPSQYEKIKDLIIQYPFLANILIVGPLLSSGFYLHAISGITSLLSIAFSFKTLHIVVENQPRSSIDSDVLNDVKKTMIEDICSMQPEKNSEPDKTLTKDPAALITSF